MNAIWDANTYDAPRRRLVPCFDEFYGTVAELVSRCGPASPSLLDLGTGTGLLAWAVVQRVRVSRLCLLDRSEEMMERAAKRLAAWAPEIVLQPLTSELPEGPFDAVVSALAIHHLDHGEKRTLFKRIHERLSPGGIFVNAEQVQGRSSRVQDLFEATHLERARNLGSSEAEIEEAVVRMRQDQCATAADQIAWLDEAGFQDAACFFQSFRWAVYAGWRP